MLTSKGFQIKKSKDNLDLIDELKEELTVTPQVPLNFNKDVEPFPVYQEDKKFLYIPRYFGIEKFGKPKKYQWKNETISINFLGKLRDYQENVIKISLAKLKKDKGGLISLPCGRGKTVIALNLATQLKKKTLVIVHKTFLLNQWKERIEQFTDAKIGIIQQDKIEVENKDIVVGMLQSISKDKYTSDLFDGFGLVIFDEAHHAPSRYFSRALPIISSEYTIALSATPKRSDGLEKVLFWYFGNTIYQESNNIKRSVLVKIFNYSSTNKNFKESLFNYGNDVNLPRTINRIVKLKKRNKLIIEIIKEIIMEKGRRLLILSDRIAHLEELKNLLDQENLVESDFYIGKMKQKDLDIAKDKPVLFGSYAMASEALDIPELNTLLMLTSRRNIEQSVGRILRKQESEIQPLIIDFNDKLNCFQSQGKARKKFYQKNGYDIIEVSALNDKILGEQKLEKQQIKTVKELDLEADFLD